MQSAALVIALFQFVLLIFSLSFHECAHAWTASRLGDQTARLEGRVTLNPMYHVDMFGTLLFPAIAIFGPFVGLGALGGMIFGWAKPTPINTRNLKRIVRDENMITLAGPFSNLFLVLVGLVVLMAICAFVPDGRVVVFSTFRGMLLEGVPPGLQAAVLLSALAVQLNLALFIFNLIPIPPLDGSRLLRNALPYNAVQTYDRFNPWVCLILMMVLGGFILRLLLGPAMAIIFAVLRIVPGR